MAWYCPRCGQTADAGGSCTRDGAALAEIGSHDLIGRAIGEYTVLARLGSGAFGQVYRAVHPRSGNVVAIKLLDQPIEAAESQRVITEARAAASIRHPNVVQVYDLGITPKAEGDDFTSAPGRDRRPFIVMEYLEGQTLADAWVGRIPADEVVRVATDVLRGLAAAHRLGIVHRDLKPANVFVSGPRVVIVDFGLAKLLGDPRGPALTIKGTSLGTPRYMSPEQIRGQDIDGRTDLYALGVMMYEAIAGEPPFSAASTFQLLEQHIEKPPPELPKELPRHLTDAIDRALAKTAQERFPDADTMRRALRGDVESVHAARPRTSRSLAPILFALAGLLAVTAIVIAVVRHGRGGDAKPRPAPAQPVAGRPVLTPEDQRVVETLRANVRSMPFADLQRVLCNTEDGIATMTRYGADPYKVQVLRSFLQAYRTDPRTKAITCSDSSIRR
ncbi:MAG TPA: serine/threonine-protein kinase [Kofleriaceae bacterium]|nr:serine/threonine-protein kinase [Kofleriaceae bacterium]